MFLGTLSARDISQLSGDIPSSLGCGSEAPTVMIRMMSVVVGTQTDTAWSGQHGIPFQSPGWSQDHCCCPSHSLRKSNLDGSQIASQAGHLPPGEAPTLRGSGEGTQDGG